MHGAAIGASLPPLCQDARLPQLVQDCLAALHQARAAQQAISWQALAATWQLQLVL